MSIQELQNYLKEHNIYALVENFNNLFIIDIEDGDWKHDHLYLQYLMNNLNLNLIDKVITSSDDSDCYSATYYYSAR